MGTSDADGAAVRLPPPLVYLVAVVAGAVGHAFLWPLPLGLGPGARIAGALAAAGPGVAVIAGALGLFRRSGQEPWKSTPEVISTGVYRWTRNPMYVGMAVIQIAIGIGLANGWILALVPPVLAVVYATAIRHEERCLERKFGETYLEYRRSVRRWLRYCQELWIGLE